MSPHSKHNPSVAWFRASEAVGDFMGIRYGRITNGEVEWLEVSHCECDGIGGFLRLLRKQGLKNLAIPQTKHTCRGIVLPLCRLLSSKLKKEICAERGDWKKTAPKTNIAWYLFTKDETQAILDHCRKHGVTVNSYLLHALDQAVRPEVSRSERKISWMIPVNLRGDVCYPDDTENHVSCVETKIAQDDTAATIHRKILHQLRRGEHRANHLLLNIGRIFTHQAKVKLLTKDRTKPVGNIGAFSNLGVWNPEEITNEDGWVFSPPVVLGQLLGAGCVTFQGRLGLATQGYTESEKVGQRMQRWVENIGEPCLRPAS
ncbi:MAG: hypothetical protein ACK5JP_13200 [Akkermansiaceae bacterium]